jgi:FHS family Na+ dependent glucose MFS transporter 1
MASETEIGARSARLAPLTRSQLLNTLAYCLVFAGIGVSLTVGGPALLSLVGQTGSSVQAFGLVFAVGPIGYMLGSWIGGQVYERVPGHLTLFVSLLVMAATLAVVPAITSFWLLLPFALLTSIAAGMIELGCNVMLIWVHAGRVGPYMNALHFSFGLGAVTAQVLITGLIGAGAGITNVYWIIAILLLPVAAWVAALRSPRPLPPLPAGSDAPAAARPTRLYVIALLILLAAGIEASLGIWLFPYAVRLNLAGEAQAAVLTSIFWAALTVGRLLGTLISIRYSAQSIILVGLLITLLMVMMLVVLPSQLSLLRLAVIGLGLALGPLVPNMIVLSERLGFSSSSSTGLQLVAIGAGGLTLPVIISQLFETAGPNFALATLLPASLLALVIFFLLMPAISARQPLAGR